MKRVIPDIKALREFATDFLEENPNGGVVALEGDLGAGKTTFVRELVSVLSEKMGQTVPRIISPTFVIHQRYEIREVSFDHFDLYRLTKVGEKEAIEIGLHEALSHRGKGFVLVEWPSKLTPDSGIKFDSSIEFAIDENAVRIVHVNAS